MRVGRNHAPPVVGEYVEDAEDDDEEYSGPFGFEADGDHSACAESEDGDEYAADGPLALKDEAKEQENEEDASSKQEANRAIK